MENLIKKSREELEELIPKHIDIISAESNPICSRQAILNLFTQKQVALIENLKKWAEEKKYTNKMIDKADSEGLRQMFVHNRILEDLIQKLDKTIKEI